MNRLLTLSAIALTLTLSSCMKSTKYEASPVQGGVNIYNATNEANTIALDLTNVAVRLNTLLFEANKASITDLDKVVVNDPNDETNTKKVDISGTLFGSAKISNKGSGTYEISYPSTYNGKNDLPRKGLITINTGNKTLYESGSDWTFTQAASGSNEKPCLIILNSYGSESYIYYDWNSYSIYATGDGNIITTTDFTGYTEYNSTKTSMAWNLEAEINLGSTEGYFTFKDKSTNVSASISSSGKILGLDREFSFMSSIVDPIKYQPSCSWNFIASGSVMASYPQGPTDNIQLYPDTDVHVSFVASETACRRYTDVTYNGQTKRIQ